MRIKILLIFLICAGLSACTYLHKNSETDKENDNEIEEVSYNEKFTASTDPDTLINIINKQSQEIDSLYVQIDELFYVMDSLQQALEIANNRVAVNDDFIIPDTITFAGTLFDLKNERLQEKFEKIFKNELKAAYRYIPRSGKYFPVFDSIFTQYDVPLDVKYLAIAESGLNAVVRSRVGAGGMWQFMPGTAKGYKLKINSHIDQRSDVLLATEAAAKYLVNARNYLTERGSDDWLLTFCAYNAGPGSIAKVMKKQGGKSFFDLILRVDETNKYVWRAVAIKMIFEHEEEIFGKKFDREKSLYETTKSVKLTLKGHYTIDEWAKYQGTNVSKVWELNPWINIYKRQRRRYSPLNDVILPPGTYDILLPAEAVPDIGKVASIESKFLKKNSGYYQYHTVRSGESLYSISKKYRTSISKIKSINGLRSNVIYPGQKLKLYGSSSGSSRSNKTPIKGTKTYIVKKGDTLSGIASRAGISLKTLKRLNGMNSNTIYPGQKLIVSEGNSTSSSNSSNSGVVSSEDGAAHSVKRGETLSTIAKQYGVSVKALLNANNLNKTTIYVGQRLRIPGKKSASPRKTYTVVSGDTISGIALKLNTSQTHLIETNSLRKKQMNGKSIIILQPGQKLFY